MNTIPEASLERLIEIMACFLRTAIAAANASTAKYLCIWNEEISYKPPNFSSVDGSDRFLFLLCGVCGVNGLRGS